MSPRLRSIVTGASLATLAFLLYSVQLGRAPLSVDEMQVLQQAQSITQSGRDLAGHSLPLFTQIAGEHWQQPMAIYATVAMSAVAPPAVASRLASAIVASVSVGLLYLLLARTTRGRWVPVMATILFAVTPAVFAYARLGVDAIYPVPFVIAWLLGLQDSLSSGRLRPAVLGAFALGAGVFTQPAAPLTMGLLMATGIAVHWNAGTRRARAYAAMVAAFALPVSAAAAWFAVHPETYPDTFGRWAIHAAHLRYPLEGVRAMVNWNTLGMRGSIYWGSFDPSWLFLDGPDHPGNPLRGVAPFLAFTAVLAGLALIRVIRSGATRWMLTLVAAMLVVPLAASTFGEPHAIGRFLSLIPLVVLISAEGLIDWPWRHRLLARIGGGTLVLVLIVEFARFYTAHLSG